MEIGCDIKSLSEILEPLIRVPHIYEYNQTLDNTAEYIIEEYIDGVIVDEYTNELTMYLIGRVFGTTFNIKRQEVNLSDVFKHLNSEDKQLYRKYYSGSKIDGFVLLDVEYVLSNNKENISVIDLENCLYDDVRPYINTYAKVFGEAFVSGFAHASNMKYDDFILSDMEEYLHIVHTHLLLLRLIKCFVRAMRTHPRLVVGICFQIRINKNAFQDTNTYSRITHKIYLPSCVFIVF